MKSFPFAAHERPARRPGFSLCATFLACLPPKLPPYVSFDCLFPGGEEMPTAGRWPCAGSWMDHAGMGFRWAMAGDWDLLASDEDGARKMLFGGADLGGRTLSASLCSGRRANDHGDGGGGWLLVGGEMGFNPSGFGQTRTGGVGSRRGRRWPSRKTMAERSSSRSWLPVMGGALGGVGSGSVRCPRHFGRLGFSMQVIAGLPIADSHGCRLEEGDEAPNPVLRRCPEVCVHAV
ncbi:hypothetical protein ACLOJK_007285 [Asimina triloba]